MSGFEGTAAIIAALTAASKVTGLILTLKAHDRYEAHAQSLFSAIQLKLQAVADGMREFRLNPKQQAVYDAKVRECEVHLGFMWRCLQRFARAGGRRKRRDRLEGLRWVLRGRVELAEELTVLGALVDGLLLWREMNHTQWSRYDPNSLCAVQDPATRVHASGLVSLLVGGLSLTEFEKEISLVHHTREEGQSGDAGLDAGDDDVDDFAKDMNQDEHGSKST